MIGNHPADTPREQGLERPVTTDDPAAPPSEAVEFESESDALMAASGPLPSSQHSRFPFEEPAIAFRFGRDVGGDVVEKVVRKQKKELD